MVEKSKVLVVVVVVVVVVVEEVVVVSDVNKIGPLYHSKKQPNQELSGLAVFLPTLRY